MQRAVDAWRAARAAAGLVFLGPLTASSAPTELVLNAPPECPSAEQVARAVADLLDRPAPLAGVSVEITGERDSWQARVKTLGGERALAGESCRAVADAVAAVLALATDPGAAPESAAPGTDADSAATDADSAATDADSAAPSPPSLEPEAPRAARSVHPMLQLRGGILGEVGMLPGPSLGPTVVVGFGRGVWTLELGGSALLPRRAALSGTGAPLGDIYWFAGQAAVCREIHAPFTTCVGGELGQLVGTGSGVDAPATAHTAWIAAVLGAAWRAPLSPPGGHVFWQVAVNAAFALLRPEFGFDDLGVLHRPSMMSGRVSLGLGWH